MLDHPDKPTPGSQKAIELTQEKTFTVKFWGARGTLASNSHETTKYGGNTACVEVQVGDDTLIFDAGSGLRGLGDKMMRDAVKARKTGQKVRRTHLFFTHCHYDHISGLPFFAPLFDPKAQIDIWSGHLPGPDKTFRMISEYMRPPYFPVGPEVFSAKIRYRDFEPHDVLRPVPGAKVSTLPLNHHDECVGYRVDFNGRSVCYITDTTHILNEHDMRIVDFIKDTDLMIYDGTYTDAEFPTFWNFGHSTWEEGQRLAKMAGAKRYCIFHHRPSRKDADMDKIEAQCRKGFRRSWAAREGQKITL